jgi:hypothetical protein
MVVDLIERSGPAMAFSVEAMVHVLRPQVRGF